MDGIKDIIRDIGNRMDSLEAERESVIALSRTVIRGTKRAIHAIHAGESYDTSELQKTLNKLLAKVADRPELIASGNIQDAAAEFAEVCILSSVINGKEMPSFRDLGISPQAWVLGLADSVGEMRRSILDSLLAGDTENAERIFSCMGEIYEEIMMLDVPDVILPIRRKQDIARSVMERTRTDLANAVTRR